MSTRNLTLTLAKTRHVTTRDQDPFCVKEKSFQPIQKLL